MEPKEIFEAVSAYLDDNAFREHPGYELPDDEQKEKIKLGKTLYEKGYRIKYTDWHPIGVWDEAPAEALYSVRMRNVYIASAEHWYDAYLIKKEK